MPLGEERELYMLRVRQGETVLRVETLLSPEWTYTAAARAADGVPGLYTVEVAQVSAQVGPGAWAQITLSP